MIGLGVQSVQMMYVRYHKEEGVRDLLPLSPQTIMIK